MTEIEKSEFLRPIFGYNFCDRVQRNDWIVFMCKSDQVYWLEESNGHFIEELEKSNEVLSVNQVIEDDEDYIILKTVYLGVPSFVKMKMDEREGCDRDFVFSVTACINGLWI